MSTTTPLQALAALERRGVITSDPDEALTCCGIERDDDGFCQHRPHHPIFVGLDDGSEEAGR